MVTAAQAHWLNRRRRQKQQYRAETLALLARMTDQPTLQRKLLINGLVRALVDAGVWAKLDAFYVLAAHDAQAAQRNWIADAFNLTPTSAPTFTADRGYAGDGVASYLATGFTPSTGGSKYVLDDALLGVYVNTNVVENKADIGTFITGSATFVNSRREGLNTTDGEVNNAAGGALRTAIATTIGLSIAQRSASNAMQFYRDGVLFDTGTTVSSALSTAQVTVLASFSGSSFGTKRVAAALIGQSLTADEHTALYAALDDYLQDVGAA